MKKVLVVAAASIVGVVALEVGFRIFKPFLPIGIRRAYEYDPEMGYRLKPGLNLTRITDHLEEVHSNRLGTVNYQDCKRPCWRGSPPPLASRAPGWW